VGDGLCRKSSRRVKDSDWTSLYVNDFRVVDNVVGVFDACWVIGLHYVTSWYSGRIFVEVPYNNAGTQFV